MMHSDQASPESWTIKPPKNFRGHDPEGSESSYTLEPQSHGRACRGDTLASASDLESG